MMLQRSLRVSVVGWLVAGLAACGGADAPSGPATEIALTDSAAAALPAFIVTDGPRLCEADGRTLCPVRDAYAARLDARRVALWRMGGLAAWFEPGDTTLTQIGRLKEGDTDGYQNVTAIAAKGADNFLVFDASMDGFRLLEFDGEGRMTSSEAPQLPEGTSTLGFVGEVPVLQVIRGQGDSLPARLQIIRMRAPDDSSGSVVLDAPIPWMRAIGNKLRAIPPLFGAAPVFAYDPELGLVWSPGDTGRIERRDTKGRVLWQVRGLTGPATDNADVAARRQELDASMAIPISDEEFARMSAKVQPRHAAVGGLVFSRSGAVLVAGAVVPTRDSVDWYRLAADGSPIGRLRLAKRVRILLDEGDSLLVHRPTEGETTEVRWLRLNLPTAAPSN